MIEATTLTKRFGATLAVDELSFTVRPGQVTGFLGPNGAGKSTTMRMIVGLDRPTAGTATVNGRPYRDHAAPLRQVGALLEAKSVHKGRAARSHLLALAQTHGIPASRVDEVLAMVGLESVAGRRAGLLPRHGPAARHRRPRCSAIPPRSSWRHAAAPPAGCRLGRWTDGPGAAAPDCSLSGIHGGSTPVS